MLGLNLERTCTFQWSKIPLSQGGVTKTLFFKLYLHDFLKGIA